MLTLRYFTRTTTRANIFPWYPPLPIPETVWATLWPHWPSRLKHCTGNGWRTVKICNAAFWKWNFNLLKNLMDFLRNLMFSLPRLKLYPVWALLLMLYSLMERCTWAIQFWWQEWKAPLLRKLGSCLCRSLWEKCALR